MPGTHRDFGPTHIPSTAEEVAAERAARRQVRERVRHYVADPKEQAMLVDMLGLADNPRPMQSTRQVRIREKQEKQAAQKAAEQPPGHALGQAQRHTA